MAEDKFEEAAKRAVIEEESKNNLYGKSSEPDKKADVSPLDEPNYKSLGKVDKKFANDSESSASPMGYIALVMENLPSKGKFYPEGTKLYIRAANVQEIRDFSTVEETNLFDVDDKLNNILLSCIRMELGNGRKGLYKDILEEDRIYVILSVRELTFKQGENSLNLKGLCGQCENENGFELRTNNLQYQDDVPEIEKYYSDEEKAYIIPTKSAGILKMAPPKIGVMKEVTAYIKERQEKGEKWDKAFLQIVPYIITDWREFNQKKLFDALVDFQGWSANKFNIIYKLADMMKIGVKPELKLPCEKCGAEVTVPVSFPGGIKSLFIIQDISGELL
jgi:hypothetical protein